MENNNEFFNDRDRDIINDRDKALFEAYNTVLKKHGALARRLPKQMLYEEASECPAPRFYISAKQAGRIINNLLKGNTNPEQMKAARAKKNGHK